MTQQTSEQEATRRRERAALDPVIARVRAEVARVIVGQERLIDRLLIALVTEQHALIEGVPGLAKTLTVSTLADALHLSFARIQFTPDLLPADITGTLMFSQRDGDFRVRRGPLFAERDPRRRDQSCAREGAVGAAGGDAGAAGDDRWGVAPRCPQPFFVLATQNPIEHEGTYPLPEAQLDRFMLNVLVGYPEREEERTILDRSLDGEEPTIEAVTDARELAQLARASGGRSRSTSGFASTWCG